MLVPSVVVKVAMIKILSVFALVVRFRIRRAAAAAPVIIRVRLVIVGFIAVPFGMENLRPAMHQEAWRK
ncbi:hypothetical protein D1012_14210 [Pseudotabrizicola alkalilacus]|uniref:Uncharacterized protein n=1 Tax=Pseudotabrizicola alkalilacus TaxID=2305252 RepID=A0A411YZY8_9RHOB|nr:hypothetical protein D1012_14210 [Pseudotabrizicola alkalilacus]